MLSSKTRRNSTITVFVASMFVFVYYIANYAYNVTNNKSLTTDLSINCITNICVSYDNIKECIHIGSPTLFKIEVNPDHKYLGTAIQTVEYTTLKEGCR